MKVMLRDVLLEDLSTLEHTYSCRHRRQGITWCCRTSRSAVRHGAVVADRLIRPASRPIAPLRPKETKMTPLCRSARRLPTFRAVHRLGASPGSRRCATAAVFASDMGEIAPAEAMLLLRRDVAYLTVSASTCCCSWRLIFG